MNDSVRCLPLKSVSGFEKPVRSRRKWAEVYSKCSKWWPAWALPTCTQPGTPLINGFVDHALWKRWRSGDTSYTPVWDTAR